MAITPLAPVHGEARRSENGDIRLRWIRRSRIDNGWKDEVDQLMVEEKESYRVSLYAGDEPLGDWLTSQAQFTLVASQAPGAGSVEPYAARAEIRQLGRHAQSAPLIIKL